MARRINAMLGWAVLIAAFAMVAGLTLGGPAWPRRVLSVFAGAG